jgi:hypothetical protein
VENTEKRTLLFKRNRQYEAEGKGHRVWGKQKAVSSRQEAEESQIAESEKGT